MALSTYTVFLLCLLPCLQALSVQPPRTFLSPVLTSFSRAQLPNYSPQYSPIYRPLSFQPRLVCSACSCSGDFWCASYCPKCATESYCSSCSCISSLACRDKCDVCKGASSPPILTPPEEDCTASGGPPGSLAQGKECIFPFTYGGVKYHGCAPLYGGVTRGLTPSYSPVFWCSTKVDINGFHVRGPWSQSQGKFVPKYVGYCGQTCPRVNTLY